MDRVVCLSAIFALQRQAYVLELAGEVELLAVDIQLQRFDYLQKKEGRKESITVSEWVINNASRAAEGLIDK